MDYDELKGKAIQAPLFMSDLFLERSAPIVIRYIFKALSGNLNIYISLILYGVVSLNCYTFYWKFICIPYTLPKHRRINVEKNVHRN